MIFARPLPVLLLVCTMALPLYGCGPSKTELAGEIAALKEQLAQRQTEGTSLQQQIASARTELEAERKALAESKAAAEVTAKALEQARSEQASRNTRISDLEIDKQRLDQRVSELSRIVEATNAEAAQVRSELVKATDEARRIETELRQSLDATRLAERSAATERDALASEAASMRGRLAELDRQLQQRSGNLEQEQKRASDLTDRLAAALREQSGLRQISDAQRAELTAISASLADAQATVARLTGARGIYTVQDGDSLSSIALFFYRNANRWPGIAQANRHLINHPDRIFPAMVLIIPK